MNDIFRWDKDFTTGMEIIDRQHMKLIEIINEGIKLSVNETSITGEKISALKNSLEEYVAIHFSTEEKIMDEYRVFDLHKNEHKKAHKSFIEKFNRFFTGDIPATPTNLNDILEFLVRWLAYHILNTDKSLCKQIALIKNGEPPHSAYEKETRDTEDSTEPLLKALRALFYLVSEKNRDLEEANEGLEHKVRQRTAELEEANRRLEALSLSDSLTGLPNRRYSEIIIDQLIETWKRYKKTFALMFIDIDKFKTVNDTLGHDTGDNLLKWVAGFLRSNLRKSDIICRLGGDEFIVICPESDLESTGVVANNILFKINKNTDNVSFGRWTPSISIGMSMVSESNNSAELLLSSSDKAMYESKKRGGNITTASS